MKITNPILKGFNPDPAIIRVEDDYYIATSTFEWFPGFQIHHSKDLKNWKLINHVLTRSSQLDMKGAPDSCGVWAPCLTFDNGTFYAIFTNVKSFDGVWKDTPNFMVTTDDIQKGEWSEPIYLNSSGFDASLFHDDDGRKWFLNMIVDHRGGKFFGGVYLQEYDSEQNKLVGPIKNIFPGTELGCTEAPHIYKRNGWYYLMTAEGGTEYGHAVTLCRSKNIWGPYELHPTNPVITARNNPDLPLQKSGHASIVKTQTGDWYAAFLVGRPLKKHGRCTLGRETAIAPVEWREDGWLYHKGDNNEPQLEVEVEGLPESPWQPEPVRDDFDSEKLNVNFSSLRVPVNENWATLKERPGFLRLYGRESLQSIHEQSLVARRIQAFNVEAATCFEFSPDTFQQMAGLVFYYNTMHMHYAHVSYNEETDTKYLQIISADNGAFSEPLESIVEIIGDRVYLKGNMNREDLQFYYSLDDENWEKLGPVLDASILSDDYVRDNGLHYRAAFTGSFVGICCQDLSGRKKHADFDWFEYKEL
ncbi:xylan 1,4-beta-xylosidase [Mariniphaga anaerophila]|uniref:Xylan 1,4-beta-xylosidase n=1 Tax=Mariniphaga anaerophila TaxID=1484053 RepID=A0A1M4U6F2_9BACT|nr:glycoside hydrolase family 43 protein [Mariniphaga anaerophila]SHE52200.1 xylan 1,4-beta-xylosidase [Mariniphaga anaerophila]